MTDDRGGIDVGRLTSRASWAGGAVDDARSAECAASRRGHLDVVLAPDDVPRCGHCGAVLSPDALRRAGVKAHRAR